METAVQEYVNDREALKITGIAVQTYRNWRQNKKGPVYCKIGASVRYSIEDLRSFMEMYRVNPSAGN